MISAILQPLTHRYSRLIAMGNHGEMAATYLPADGERLAALPSSYHNGFAPGAFVEHKHDTVYPVDLPAKFEALSESHLAYCEDCNDWPYDSDPAAVSSRSRVYSEMVAIATALLSDEQVDELERSQAADPEVCYQALRGDAYARYDLYRASQWSNEA